MTDEGGRARPVILAAPSGTGKTTIARRLVDGDPRFVFSVSATTRPRRPGERPGVDYDFVTAAAFQRMLEEGKLVEWAEVHGNRYGTPRRNLDAAAARGEHVVLDIDVQGARQIRDVVPDALLLFVLPPSAEALVARLARRGTEGRRELLRRLRNAREELLDAPVFDHVVVNEELDAAVARVRALVAGEAASGDATGGGLGEPLAEAVRRLRAEIDDILARMAGERPGEASVARPPDAAPGLRPTRGSGSGAGANGPGRG